jgi:hypothetical protein
VSQLSIEAGDDEMTNVAELMEDFLVVAWAALLPVALIVGILQ